MNFHVIHGKLAVIEGLTSDVPSQQYPAGVPDATPATSRSSPAGDDGVTVSEPKQKATPQPPSGTGEASGLTSPQPKLLAAQDEPPPVPRPENVAPASDKTRQAALEQEHEADTTEVADTVTVDRDEERSAFSPSRGVLGGEEASTNASPSSTEKDGMIKRTARGRGTHEAVPCPTHGELQYFSRRC